MNYQFAGNFNAVRGYILVFGLVDHFIQILTSYRHCIVLAELKLSFFLIS